jgi:Recombination endonuclease VII/NUMOD3 motif
MERRRWSEERRQSHAARMRETWQNPEIRARRVAGLKQAWEDSERVAEAKERAKLPGMGTFQPGHQESTELRERKSELFSGEGNPYFGKKHSDEVRQKMQRPKGVIERGMSPEEYQTRLNEGLRWCVDCNDFRPGDQFNKRGFRRGFERKSSLCKKCNRARHLDRKFGVTPEWYEAKLAEQGGHCAFCPITEVEEGRPLAVDHNHETGQPRGLACTRCNSGLERFEAIPNWADMVHAYLERYATEARELRMSVTASGLLPRDIPSAGEIS